MAASMLIRRWGPHKLLFNSLISANKTPVRNGYIVLLPDFPPEVDQDTNPVLRSSSLPEFGSFNAEHCLSALLKCMGQQEMGFVNLEESLNDASSKHNLTSIVQRMEELMVPLDYSWNLVRHLYVVKHDRNIAQLYEKMKDRVQIVRSKRYQSLPLYRKLKDLAADSKSMSVQERRILEKYLLECRLAGIELGKREKERLDSINKDLNIEKINYRQKLKVGTDMFKHVITDYTVVKDFPNSLLHFMGRESMNPEKGPWVVSLRPPIYEQFLQFCGDRDICRKVWLAAVGRCSVRGVSELNNSIHVEKIRSIRKDVAKKLGYSSYFDMSMETKMAGNAENVKSMIDSIFLHSKASMDSEMGQLQKFAKDRGFETDLQLWDVPFWRRKEQKSLFNIDHETLREYFPLPKVAQGLFSLCERLFGIQIKESEAQVWHPDVKFYKVYENDVHVGSFYFDPYMRPREKILTPTHMTVGATANSFSSSLPFAYLICNFSPPNYGKPSLLSLDEIHKLFHEFGRILQHVLTTVKFSDISGTTNIEWDAVNVCPYFLECWLTAPKVLQSLSGHVDSGEPISDDVANNVEKARCHMAGYDLNRQLYLANLDLQLYSTKKFWLEIVKQSWPKFVPFPLDKEDFHVCSLPEIITDDLVAAYYGKLWSHVLAADIYSAFVEVGLENEAEVGKLGRRFRDTFLALGGSCHSGEVFRMFRGRDPSTNALINHYKLK